MRLRREKEAARAAAAAHAAATAAALQAAADAVTPEALAAARQTLSQQLRESTLLIQSRCPSKVCAPACSSRRHAPLTARSARLSSYACTRVAAETPGVTRRASSACRERTERRRRGQPRSPPPSCALRSSPRRLPPPPPSAHRLRPPPPQRRPRKRAALRRLPPPRLPRWTRGRACFGAPRAWRPWTTCLTPRNHRRRSRSSRRLRLSCRRLLHRPPRRWLSSHRAPTRRLRARAPEKLRRLLGPPSLPCRARPSLRQTSRLRCRRSARRSGECW